MTGALTIARYEITRRWTLWIVALAFGLVPMVLSSPGPLHSFDERFGETLLLGVVVLSWTVAFITGMSLLGRPLHDGRLSFYFTRPMSSPAIATGKVIGGVVLIAGMEIILLLPLLDARTELFESTTPTLFAAGIAMVFLAVGIVVGILARSRSRWFLADALGAATTSMLGMLVFAKLADYKSKVAATQEFEWEDVMARFKFVDRLLLGIVIVAVLVAIVAAIAAVAVGRTDRERVHRALSFTLWPALAGTALVGLAVAQWGLP